MKRVFLGLAALAILALVAGDALSQKGGKSDRGKGKGGFDRKFGGKGGKGGFGKGGKGGFGKGGKGRFGGKGGKGRFGGKGGKGGRFSFFSRMNPLLIAIDKNKDGELDAKELKNAVRSLMTLDKNKDGKLSQEELRPSFSGFGGKGGFGKGKGGFGKGKGGFGKGKRRPGGKGRPGGAKGRPGGDDTVQSPFRRSGRSGFGRSRSNGRPGGDL